MKTELVEFLQDFARDGKVCASDQPLLYSTSHCLSGCVGGVTEGCGGVL